MEKWITSSFSTVFFITITTFLIVASTIMLTRLFGKRSFSKMSSFDFACTVAIGSIIATTIVSASVSFVDGFIGLLVLYAIQIAIAHLRKYDLVKSIVDNEPVLLMKGSEILHENLKKSSVTEGDLRAKLREANVIELSEVRAVVFETTGDIAVLHASNPDRELEDWLLKDVKTEA